MPHLSTGATGAMRDLRADDVRPVAHHSRTQPQSGGARVLRLLSYNIQTGIATTNFHRYLVQSWKHVLPYAGRVDNLDSIARLVSDFDVVGLQEVDAGSLRSGFINQAEYLADQAGFPYWHCQTNRNLGKLAQHSLGLLSRYRPREIREHKLPGMIPGRGVLWVRFGTGSHSLILLILHLALGRRARLRQLAFISELVNGHRNVIMMGDLNCRSSSREMDLLMRSTHLCEPTPGLNTFPSWRPYRNIDHILVSSSLRVQSVQVLNYLFSDHLPVAMEVILPDEVVFSEG